MSETVPGLDIRRVVIGAAVGALSFGGLLPLVTIPMRAESTGKLETCQAYEKANPETKRQMVPAGSVPATVLKACGLDFYLKGPDTTPENRELYMGMQVNHDTTLVGLPDSVLLSERIAYSKDPTKDIGLLAGLGAMCGGIIGNFWGRRRFGALIDMLISR